MLHMQLKKCVSSWAQQQISPSTIEAFLKFGDHLVNFQMANALETLQKMQGRGRGLLLVWRRELERKPHLNRYLPGQSRGATLEIMAQMDRHQGHRQETVNMTSDICDQDNGDTKSTRTQYHQMSPHAEAIPQWLPNTWPECLGRSAPMHCSFQLPSPTPSSTSSDLSGPPSLESLAGLESGYEASISSALSSDTN